LSSIQFTFLKGEKIMAANVETMFYQGQEPWHGLGTKIPDGKKLSIDEALVASGLNWLVYKRPLITVKKAQEQAREIVAKIMSRSEDVDIDTLIEEIQANVDHVAIERDTDEQKLGVVGSGYEPLQNHEGFQTFQPFLDANECTLHTAGSLDCGKKVWVLAEINKVQMEILPNDNVSRFVLLSNSFDGTSAVRVGYTPIRVVCANTLAMAHSCSQLIRIRHSKGMLPTLEQVRDTMCLANQNFEATAEQYRYLATRAIANQNDLRQYVKVCLDLDIPDDELKTRGSNLIDKVMHLCVAGTGIMDTPAEGTWWGAYNGITEFWNHEQGSKENTLKSRNNRLRNVWFQKVSKSVDALELATKMAG